MAEFSEVMRQWIRAKRENVTCPEDTKLSIKTIYEWDDKRIAQLELEVMEWAKEHPEPLYPTWWEFLCENGVLNGKECQGRLIRTKLAKGISKEIAEKLGLKPL